MPTKRSRSFRDISLSFKRHPITNDVTVLKNEDAIKKSVINLIRTKVGERFFNDILGTSVGDTLFELDLPSFSDYLKLIQHFDNCF